LMKPPSSGATDTSAPERKNEPIIIDPRNLCLEAQKRWPVHAAI
jgi:hypothetical protein